jgi:hypothetical protein
VEVVVVLAPERAEVECSEENTGEEAPESGLDGLANFMGVVLNSDGAVLLGYSEAHVGEGVQRRGVGCAESSAGEV